MTGSPHCGQPRVAATAFGWTAPRSRTRRARGGERPRVLGLGVGARCRRPRADRLRLASSIKRTRSSRSVGRASLVAAARCSIANRNDRSSSGSTADLTGAPCAGHGQRRAEHSGAHLAAVAGIAGRGGSPRRRPVAKTAGRAVRRAGARCACDALRSARRATSRDAVERVERPRQVAAHRLDTRRRRSSRRRRRRRRCGRRSRRGAPRCRVLPASSQTRARRQLRRQLTRHRAVHGVEARDRTGWRRPAASAANPAYQIARHSHGSTSSTALIRPLRSGLLAGLDRGEDRGEATSRSARGGCRARASRSTGSAIETAGQPRRCAGSLGSRPQRRQVLPRQARPSRIAGSVNSAGRRRHQASPWADEAGRAATTSRSTPSSCSRISSADWKRSSGSARRALQHEAVERVVTLEQRRRRRPAAATSTYVIW